MTSGVSRGRLGLAEPRSRPDGKDESLVRHFHDLVPDAGITQQPSLQLDEDGVDSRKQFIIRNPG